MQLVADPEQVTLDHLPAEWLAPGATVHTMTPIEGTEDGGGSLYSWRQGPVAVVLTVFTGADDTRDRKTPIGKRYAELQRDKLAAAPISRGE